MAYLRDYEFPARNVNAAQLGRPMHSALEPINWMENYIVSYVLDFCSRVAVAV